MKALFVVVLSMYMSGAVAAQEAASAQQPPAPQAAPALQSNAAGDSGANPSADIPSPSSASGYGYGSSGYGHRAEVFVTGFGQFADHASGNAIAEQVTNTGGFAVGYRFHLNSSSALEGRYGFSRDSEVYASGGASASIPAYLSEISGSYIYSFAKSRRYRPFLEGGGGVILFSPGNYGASSNSAAGGSTGTGGTPINPVFPYIVAQPADATATASSASSAVATRQAEGMFLFGAGADISAFSHFYVRIEFRALMYKTPDFNLSGLQTNAFSAAYEPSIGFSYRF